MTVAQLASEALALPDDLRALLAEQLVASLPTSDRAEQTDPNRNLPVAFEETASTENGSVIRSFVQTARSLKLDGPADWSENLDAYLYGDKPSK